MNAVEDTTLETRLDLFNKREQDVLEQMHELEKTMAMIHIKKWWYTASLELGSDELVRAIDSSQYPKDIYDKFV